MTFEQLINTITDWPVIFQGALGSALFWVVIEGGQRATKLIKHKISGDLQTANNWSLTAHEAPPSEWRDAARFYCIYGAFHYTLKAIIVAVLAVAASSFISVFAHVGFLITLYFAFRALSYVPHTTSHGSVAERKAKLAAVIANIDASQIAPKSETHSKLD